MSKQKSEKFTVTVTPEKPRPEKPLVELSEDQLKAIAGDQPSFLVPDPKFPPKK